MENENKTASEENLPAVVEQPEPEVKFHNMEEMDQKANNIILVCTAAASATCALPIPFADAPILIGEQTAMLARLCEVYKINMEKQALSSLLCGVIGVSGTTILGKSIFSSLIKLIPGAGSVAGGAIAAATGASLTAALGKAWCILCKDVLSGDRDLYDLPGKEGIKLLGTALKDQLRLEMTEKEDNDVLKKQPVPHDEQVIPMGKVPEDVLEKNKIPQDNEIIEMEDKHPAQPKEDSPANA